MHLALEISNTRLAFFELKKDGAILLLEDLFLDLSETACKQTLSKNLELLPRFNEIEQISCSYIGLAFTLVPTYLFSTSTPEQLLQFTSSSEIPKNDLEYNRLPEWNAVLIYQMPYWIKMSLIPKFPTVVIQHDLTHQLRSLNIGSLALPKMNVIAHQEYFSVSFRNNGEIVHCSMHDFINADDILYHLMMCLEQIMVFGTIEFIVSTSLVKNLIVLEDLGRKAKSIEKLSKQKWTIGLNKHIEYQEFCV